ncbi:MAG: hypothetical protein Q9M97_04595 [Candidatus Gracilibacteria bacterium]|nr:hypothetical protein [Candidatus Gracilibacteria bacterium]
MEKIIDINNNGIIGEKDKVTLILSYIPFIGYYIYSEYYKNKLIQKIIKLNLTISVIISLIYISGNKNITILFILFYIIFAVFSSINIIINNKIIGINTYFIPSILDIINYIKIYFEYLKNYFTKKEFISIKILNINIIEKQREEEKII